MFVYNQKNIHQPKNTQIQLLFQREENKEEANNTHGNGYRMIFLNPME